MRLFIAIELNNDTGGQQWQYYKGLPTPKNGHIKAGRSLK